MKIHQIGAFEAKTKLSALLEMVQRGQVFHITKRGRSVAVLQGMDSTADIGIATKQRSLGARLRSLRSRAKAGSESVRELVASGRR